MKKHKLITLNNMGGQPEVFYFFIFLFNGLMLMLFGKRIEKFFIHMSFLQRYGLILVLSSLAMFTLYEVFSKQAKKIQNVIMSISLFIAAIYVLLDKLDLLIQFIQMLSGTILLLTTLMSANLLALLMRKFREINKKIEDPTERITILIGFFGILISLLNLL